MVSVEQSEEEEERTKPKLTTSEIVGICFFGGLFIGLLLGGILTVV